MHLKRLIGLTAVFVMTTGSCPSCIGQSTGEAVPKVPVGTIIGDTPPAGWTHVLLVANPRVSDGDVDSISDSVVRYASLFKFVILARAEAAPTEHSTEGTENRPHPLQEVAVGLAVARQGKLVIASGASSAGASSAESQPPRLGLIERQLLRVAEASLDEMRIVARQTTLLIFDSPGIVREQQQNRERIVRTLVWVSPDSGRVATAVWLLKPDEGEGLQAAGDYGVVLPNGFREDRRLHVDASLITFGIPSPQAFSLVRLPPGKPFRIDAKLGRAACRDHYTQEQIVELVNLLNGAIRGD